MLWRYAAVTGVVLLTDLSQGGRLSPSGVVLRFVFAVVARACSPRSSGSFASTAFRSSGLSAG